MFKADIPALVKSAAEIIRAERARYYPIIISIAEYAREHRLQISAPAWMLDDVPPTDGFLLWTSNALQTSTALANIIFRQHTPVVYVRTLLPYDEFEIHVLGRALFTVCRYPQIKHVNAIRLYKHQPHETKLFGCITFMDPEIEIIAQYRRLYSPFPECWERAVAVEARMWDIISRRAGISGGRPHSSGPNPHTAARQLRQHIYDILRSHDLGVLIGHWAVGHIRGESAAGEKLQILLRHDLTPELLVKKLGALLRDVMQARFSHRTEPTNVPGDYWLQRTTYYVGDSTERIAIMDTFNSQTYEIVPYVIQDGVKVGNAHLICRFYMIDKWLLTVLAGSGALKSDMVAQKTGLIDRQVSLVRGMEHLKFGDQYDGVWKDMVIEKRRMIKAQDKKFPMYYPAMHEKAHGKLREF